MTLGADATASEKEKWLVSYRRIESEPIQSRTEESIVVEQGQVCLTIDDKFLADAFCKTNCFTKVISVKWFSRQYNILVRLPCRSIVSAEKRAAQQAQLRASNSSKQEVLLSGWHQKLGYSCVTRIIEGVNRIRSVFQMSPKIVQGLDIQSVLWQKSVKRRRPEVA